MICELCKKRTATVHLTDLMSGDKLEKHLCEKCAKQEGVEEESHAPFEKLLTSFVMASASAQEAAQITCDECGMTYAEFRTSGLLGCQHDYTAFESVLQTLLERAHGGATHHIGKVPKGTAPSDRRQVDLLRLRQELADAVKSEDYERAAALRDSIKGLEAS